MKNFISTSCAALLAIASATPSFAETRSAPGEWRPDNAAALQDLYSCDPDSWVRVVSEETGETLYANNWTCEPGRASEPGRERCNTKSPGGGKGIIKLTGSYKCFD